MGGSGGGFLGTVADTVSPGLKWITGKGWTDTLRGDTGGGQQVYGGVMPTRPEYQSLLDPGTGLLKSQYQGNINPNTQAIEALRTKGLETGPSAWQNLALEQQRLGEAQQRQGAQEQGASAGAEARSQLAKTYGLSPAAQERLAMSGQRAQMAGMQNLGAQGEQARALINMQNEQMKNQILGALPGQENQLAQNQQAQQQWNIGNAINQTSMKNAADLAAYNKQMETYGAGQNATAMRNAGGSGKK